MAKLINHKIVEAYSVSQLNKKIAELEILGWESDSMAFNNEKGSFYVIMKKESN